MIDGKKFQSRSATLGNALAGENGVHTNPFGGGASAPVIRGQEGVRVKMLQNGSDVVDMSAISPDHAVASDTLLAKQVEIVRGTPTLLYSSASPAGVVNITDSRIPEKVPEKGYEGEVFVRADSASKERAATAGLTLGLGSRVALRLEGLSRKSDLYKVPGVKLEETVYRLPDSNNKSHVGTLGLSYAGEKGYLGAAYSCRNDDYGVVGHNHMYDPCSAHIFNPENRTTFENRDYLLMYPHLMDGSDLIRELHFHCGTPHEENKPHSHDNIYGHHHDQIALFSCRFDVRGEWRQPFAGLDKLKISAAHADYHHDELHDGKFYTDPLYPEAEQKRRADTAAARKGKPETVFANKGFNARIEAYHSPIGSLKGLIGAQYQTQKSSAVRLMEDRDVEKNRFALVPNTDKRASIFALEQLKLGSVTLEAGEPGSGSALPCTTTAPPSKNLSAAAPPPSAAARSPIWPTAAKARFPIPAQYCGTSAPPTASRSPPRTTSACPRRWSFTTTANTLPPNRSSTATKSSKKSVPTTLKSASPTTAAACTTKSARTTTALPTTSPNENLHRSGNLFIRRYNQTPARFTGAEGEIGWRITPKHDITLFGDFVKGRLKNPPAITGEKNLQPRRRLRRRRRRTHLLRTRHGHNQPAQPQCRPRPPARLGFRLTSEIGRHWLATLEYTRVFAQRRTSQACSPKPTKKWIRTTKTSATKKKHAPAASTLYPRPKIPHAATTASTPASATEANGGERANTPYRCTATTCSTKKSTSTTPTCPMYRRWDATSCSA